MHDTSQGIIQKIPGSYKSEKPNIITEIDKVHSKCDCIDGSIVNGVRKPILFSVGLDKPPSHKTYKKRIIQLFKKINKPVLSHTTFYLKVDEHKAVDFNGGTIFYTC